MLMLQKVAEENVIRNVKDLVVAVGPFFGKAAGDKLFRSFGWTLRRN
jgi:hypothetical protein